MKAKELTLKEKRELKIYYKLLSQKMGVDSDEALLGQILKMRKLLLHMQKPWIRYIPMLHKGFTLYYGNFEGQSRKKTLRISTELIFLFSQISTMNPFFAEMSDFYKIQENELKMLLSEDSSQ